MSHKNDKIIIKTPQQIANIRKSGEYLTEILGILYKKAVAGLTLIELEFIAEHYIKEHNLKGAFKGYNGFPANLCLSVNDCVVHGIPDRYVLKDGDVLKVDCGITYEKGITDSAFTKIIGGEDANPLGYALAKATKECLDLAIQNIAPGRPMYDYAHTAFDHIKNKGFSMIKKLTGHGVGVKVHEKPHIYNYAHPDMKKIKFEPGMVLAFEPITAITSEDFEMRPDSEWNLYCTNCDIGGHWEYTILITETGYEILSGLQEFEGS